MDVWRVTWGGGARGDCDVHSYASAIMLELANKHFQVCEYEAQLSGVKEVQAAAKAAAGGGQDLEQEVQEAFEEMNTQRAIYDKCARLPTYTCIKC